ncbi:DUF6691 family protein [Woodsholea maritima]|uniref:DUF6691 family protein n=1 Tax=Woodsholea maritima TaxID=240237 RepID=UPI000375C65A|nr:DUF6691 family protein [Woodsholea maritima]
MRAILSAGLAGLIFGAGLTLSQMVNPQKVINFLDITGHWDPSLAFVMAGAIAITLPGFWLIRKRQNRPLCAPNHAWPTKTTLDKRLIGGAVLFGIGWGLMGLCPGPALAQLSLNPLPGLYFVLIMIAGLVATRFILRRIG